MRNEVTTAFLLVLVTLGRKEDVWRKVNEGSDDVYIRQRQHAPDHVIFLSLAKISARSPTLDLKFLRNRRRPHNTFRSTQSLHNQSSPRPQSWRTIRENSSICRYSQDTRNAHKNLSNCIKADLPTPLVMSHASAAPPTASSRPRTTHPSRSLLERLMRTVDSPAKAKSMPSAASYEQWARATIP